MDGSDEVLCLNNVEKLQILKSLQTFKHLVIGEVF